LAREAGINSLEALRFVEKIGIPAKNHMSSLKSEDADRFRVFMADLRTPSVTDYKVALEFDGEICRLVWLSNSGLVLPHPPCIGHEPSFSCFFVSRLSEQEKSINDFECLLSDPSTTEHDIRRFLYSHQELFVLLGYSDVQTEVCLPGTLDHEERRIDFLLKPVGEEFYDILELQRPDCSTYNEVRGIPGFAARVYHALEQARRCRAIIDHNSEVKHHLEKQHGVKCYLPRCMVFIGKADSKLSSTERRELKRTSEPDKVFAYDEITQLLKENFRIRFK
jgi:hypothetical protein